MKRRTFLIRVGGALVAVPAALKLTACGDDGNGNGGTPDGGGGDSFTVMNQDDAGHSHTFSVECTDLSSQTEVTFTATGSGHSHSVTLTAQQLTMVAGGTTVMVNTTTPHNHTWVVSKGNSC